MVNILSDYGVFINCVYMSNSGFLNQIIVLTSFGTWSGQLLIAYGIFINCVYMSNNGFLNQIIVLTSF